VKATTHTEVYRRFAGSLRRRPLRSLVLAGSSVRGGFKRKLPALLLYSPMAIACIIASFRVHFGFALAEEAAQSGDPRAVLVGPKLQQVLGDTVENIFSFLQNSSWFGLIVITWYGAGLVAEDRRSGANLLYFARPLRRRDYVLGKFLAACAFGALAMIVPCLVICSVAAFSSPDWSFLLEEWETIPQVLLFGSLWVGTLALVVLAVSSLVDRKTHAMVGAAGVVFGSYAVSKALARVLSESRLTLFNLFDDFARVGEKIFGRELVPEREVGVEESLLALAVVIVACLVVVNTRVRKLEVVA